MNSMHDALIEALEHPIVEGPRALAKTGHRRGNVARSAGRETASDPFLWPALGAVGASFILRAAGKTTAARRVGLLASLFFACGLCNKMIKSLGSHEAPSPVNTD
jgi:hypothetical protein